MVATKEQEAAKAAEAKKRFAGRLVQIRKSYGAASGRPDLDMMSMAADLGVESERYRRYERGETEPPVWLLEEICEVTGITADVLIGRKAATPVHKVVDAALVSEVATRLRAVRAALTQRVRTDTAFAALCGSDVTRLEAWLQGQEMPDVVSMTALSEKTGVNLDWIFRGRWDDVRPEIAIRLRAALEGVSILPPALSAEPDPVPVVQRPAIEARPPENPSNATKGRRKTAGAVSR